jgi:hypothetical protein
VHRPLSKVMVTTKQEGSREIVVQVRRKETMQRLRAAERVRDNKGCVGHL